MDLVPAVDYLVMEMIDFIAQYTFFMFLLVCIKHRDILIDMTDGNVERLEREERRYQEALWSLSEKTTDSSAIADLWLSNMQERKVL